MGLHQNIHSPCRPHFPCAKNYVIVKWLPKVRGAAVSKKTSIHYIRLTGLDDNWTFDHGLVNNILQIGCNQNLQSLFFHFLLLFCLNILFGHSLKSPSQNIFSLFLVVKFISFHKFLYSLFPELTIHHNRSVFLISTKMAPLKVTRSSQIKVSFYV